MPAKYPLVIIVVVYLLFTFSCATKAPIVSQTRELRIPRIKMSLDAPGRIIGTDETFTLSPVITPVELASDVKWTWYVDGVNLKDQTPELSISFNDGQEHWVTAVATLEYRNAFQTVLVETTPNAYAGSDNKPVKNIILVIGDGMGEAQRRSASLYKYGSPRAMVMDSLPVRGLSMTNNFIDEVTDSAAGATALSSGIKTLNGRVGVDSEGENTTTILESFRDNNRSVGLVSTSPLSHATPAAFLAHNLDRENYTDMVKEMILNGGADVLLAGGEEHLLPRGDYGIYVGDSKRTDDLNLFDDARKIGYTVLQGRDQWDLLDIDSSDKLLGIFGDFGTRRIGQPPLKDLATAALTVLERNENGFFLMIEGAQIDWAGHDNQSLNNINDTLELDETVKLLKEYIKTNPQTLLIVAADHETGGLLTLEDDPELSKLKGPFTGPGGDVFHKWTNGAHSGTHVPVTAIGPYSDMLSGRYENTHIYDVMYKAAFGG